MAATRIGQILSQIVPLTDHDIEEILQEQKVTRQRFGDAAIALGFARPADVSLAWCDQVRENGGEIDLDLIGIDCQALGLLDAKTAIDYGVVPVRAAGESLVVACGEPLSDHDRHAVEQAAARPAVFVRANIEQIKTALRMYYASASSRTAA